MQSRVLFEQRGNFEQSITIFSIFSIIIILPREKSIWLATKLNSLELEVFLTSVEGDLFCKTKPSNVKDNLPRQEKNA